MCSYGTVIVGVAIASVVTHRPVATVDQPVLPEAAPQQLKHWTVKIELGRRHAGLVR